MHASPVLRHSPAAHLHIRSAALVLSTPAQDRAASTSAPHICSLLLLPQIMELNESPVFLLLDPTIDASRKELPVQLHETGGGQGQGLLGRTDCTHAAALDPSGLYPGVTVAYKATRCALPCGVQEASLVSSQRETQCPSLHLCTWCAC